MPTTNLPNLVYGDDPDAGSNPLPPQPSPQTSPDTSVASVLSAASAPPPPTPTQPPMDPKSRDMMIRTIAGEAGGEGPAGQAAVAHVILNRVAAGGYGDGIQGVVTAPVKPGSSFHQFSVWNAPGMQDSSRIARSLSANDPLYASIGHIVDSVYGGSIPDPTNGATHYYAPRSMPGGRPPPWGPELAAQNSVRIGNQIFVGGASGPGRIMPNMPSVMRLT